jgi:hypothetical protein
MDVAFLLRAQRLLDEHQPAKLDFPVLTAALAAQRAAQDKTGIRAHLRIQHGEEEALVELVLAGPGWRHAASMKQGCFSRVEAGRRINGL